jgi:LacI family transcriptional regulator, galactose operon repressor
MKDDSSSPGAHTTHYTIRDVAEKAGVSTKTVSRVLNGEAYVAEATRVRVQSVVREMGYYPHTGARSLRAHRRDCIGVTFSAPLSIVPISEALLSHIFSQLYHLFGSKGNSVSFDFGPGAGNLDADYARGLWSRRYAGLIIMGPLASSDTTILRVHESGYPYLTTSRLGCFPECSSAAVDLEEAAYVSTTCLIERGHRRIAHLTSFDGYNAGDERRAGYARALREADIEFDERLVRGATFEVHEIEALVHRLLMERGVTALIDSSAAQDAETIREGARRAGRALGQDTEVLCWTYSDKAAVMSEAFAHVWIPIREALFEGLEALAQWYVGESQGPVQVLYRPTLRETQGLEEVSKPRAVFDLRA